MDDFEEMAIAFGRGAWAVVRDEYESLAETLSDESLARLRELADAAMRETLREWRTGERRDAEWRQIDASLANLKAVNALALQRSFTRTVATLGELFLSVLGRLG